jgi:hypothetical protein
VAELRGRMPNTRELRDRERGDLIHAIAERFDGFAEVAKRQRYRYSGPKSRPSVEALRPELGPIVAELDGRMPTAAELVALKRTDLTNAIRKFGGFGKVAAALRYRYEGRNFWRTIEDLSPHLNPIVAELRGRMPNSTELRRRGHEDLVHAIHNFGGSKKVAKALGYRYEGYERWERVEDLRPYLDPIVKDLDRMPTDRELQARGLSNVSKVISDKFDGFQAVAEALHYRSEVHRRSWDSIEDLRSELDPIVAKLKRMPTIIELRGMKRFDIINAIHNFGGQGAVAQSLDIPPATDRKSWRNVEDLRPYLDPIVNKLGRMPTQDELLAGGQASLVGGIRKFGGIPKVAEALGYLYTFAPALERRARYKRLEAAILELHHAQQLAPGTS